MPGRQQYLCVSVTFLQPTYHGQLARGNQAQPEWPPSPLRLFQALVAGAAARWSSDANGADLTSVTSVASAFRWLEQLSLASPPWIVAPTATISSARPVYVPNNSMDLTAGKWTRGNALATFSDRTRKTFRPMRLVSGDSLHYLWRLADDSKPDRDSHIRCLTLAARSIVALGWGIDCAVGDARLTTAIEAAALAGRHWRPVTRAGVNAELRTPTRGTFDALICRHRAFLDRLADGTFNPAAPLSEPDYRRVAYLPESQLPPRPFAAFAVRRLGNPDTFHAFPGEHAAKVAAMLRHAACEASKADWPFPEDSARYVAGHGAPRRGPTPQRFSYLSLPSITGPHPDGMIRRVLIAEPFGGDGARADWAGRRLHGAVLIDEDTGHPAAALERLEPSDRLLPRFIGAPNGSREWTTATPVVLPGYDDLKAKKADALFWRACDQAGLPQGCIERFEFIGPPRAPTSGGFFAPNYLRGWPLRHLRIRFREPVIGPLSIGAGRHGGLGVFAVASDP